MNITFGMFLDGAQWSVKSASLGEIICGPGAFLALLEQRTGTLYQGFIDMLLELPEGFVIIDHKTHPAAHDAEKYAASCAGQLSLYRQAVEAATGKKVLQTIIHLPNLGRCYEVKVNETK